MMKSARRSVLNRWATMNVVRPAIARSSASKISCSVSLSTAAIDSETEHEIFEALDRAIAGRTTFIVAHRLSTLRRADFIIVRSEERRVGKECRYRWSPYH